MAMMRLFAIAMLCVHSTGSVLAQEVEGVVEPFSLRKAGIPIDDLRSRLRTALEDASASTGNGARPLSAPGSGERTPSEMSLETARATLQRLREALADDPVVLEVNRLFEIEENRPKRAGHGATIATLRRALNAPTSPIAAMDRLRSLTTPFSENEISSAMSAMMAVNAAAEFCSLLYDDPDDPFPPCASVDLDDGSPLGLTESTLTAATGGPRTPPPTPQGDGLVQVGSGGGRTIPSAFTFLGQFIDHDLTATEVPLNSPSAAVNALTQAGEADPTVAVASLINASHSIGQPDRSPGEDIELAVASQILASRSSSSRFPSGRSATLDLDSVYGLPLTLSDDDGFLDLIEERQLAWFASEDGETTGRFRLVRVALDENLEGFDYSRDRDGLAQIADGRNDENQLLAQTQTLFMALHNACMDELSAKNQEFDDSQSPVQESPTTETREAREAAFSTCRRDVVHVYQTIVATDYLARTGASSILEVILGRRGPDGGDPQDPFGAFASTPLVPASDIDLYFYNQCGATNGRAAMPLEFAVAAFRLGHSQVRNAYTLNHLGGTRPIFGRPDERDLSGGRPLTRIDVVDWARFLALSEAGRAGLVADPLDTKVAIRLSEMPEKALPKVPADIFDPDQAQTIIDSPGERNLARRNVARSLRTYRNAGFEGTVGLVTGNAAAAAAKKHYVRILTYGKADLPIPESVAAQVEDNQVPLWIHVLAEAEKETGGRRLGRLGTVIIGETILGALKCDSGSVVHALGDESPEEGFSIARIIRQSSNPSYDLEQLVRDLEVLRSIKLIHGG